MPSFQSAPALATVTLTDEYASSSASVLPGAMFNMVVGIDTTESLVSGQLKIQASDPDLFALDDVTFDRAIWSADPDDMLGPTPQLLNLANGNTSDDIGTLATDVLNGTGSGIMEFVSIAVSVEPNAAESTYLLSVADAVFGSATYDDVLGTLVGDLEVIVIPEPATMALGVLGLLLVKRRRRGG